MIALRIKRIYESPASTDGCRVLVDRLWPRGLSKERAAIDHWMRDLAPSDALRTWYQHDAAKWEEFQQRYFRELIDNPSMVQELVDLCAAGPVTLLYASRESELNNAAALRDYLRKRLNDLVG